MLTEKMRALMAKYPVIETEFVTSKVKELHDFVSEHKAELKRIRKNNVRKHLMLRCTLTEPMSRRQFENGKAQYSGSCSYPTEETHL